MSNISLELATQHLLCNKLQQNVKKVACITCNWPFSENLDNNHFSG